MLNVLQYYYTGLSHQVLMRLMVLFFITGTLPLRSPYKTQKRKTEHQKQILLESFQSNPHLTTAEKCRLASELNITQQQVLNWFANTRLKEGKIRPFKIMTKDQKEVLMKRFQADPCPDVTKRMQLAILLNVSESKIKGWFTNTRSKERSITSLESITDYQQQILMHSYKANRFLTDAEKCRLAKLLHTTRAVIRQWFVKTRKEETGQKILFQCESSVQK